MFLKLSTTMSMSNKQKGSALVLALFIMVVMTLLGTGLVRMISSNAETIVYEVVGTRAYQAAQAGMQRKLSEIFPLSLPSRECPINPPLYDFSTIEGLKGCKAVDVGCTSTPILGVTYYKITSTGQCTVAGVFTSRTIEVEARSL